MASEDQQLSSSLSSDLAVVPQHTKQQDNPTTPYMAHLELEGPLWSQRSAADISLPSTMLNHNEFPWATAANIEALFPGSEVSASHESSNHSFDVYNKNGSVLDSYCTSAPIDTCAMDGVEGWNTSSFDAIQPRSIPSHHPSELHSQTYLQPSMFQNDSFSTSMSFDAQHSIEQDHFEQFKESLRQQQLLTMDRHAHAMAQCQVTTPMLSEHSGETDVQVEVEEIERDMEVEAAYAQLIYRALMSVPSHCMQLSEIYNWILNNTDKVKEKSGNGWRNSIRHNLSMNQAFQKTSTDTKGKKGGKNTWRLLPEFVEEGPQSTTRYRRKTKGCRGAPRNRSRPPKPQRQLAGSKGGLAARRLADQKRTQRQREEAQTYILRSQGLRGAGDTSRSPMRVMPDFPPSPALSSELQFDYQSHPASPYFGVDDYGQSQYYSDQALSHHPQLTFGAQHGQGRPVLSVNTQQIQASQMLLASSDRNSSQGLPANISQSQILRITFQDLEGRGLFASDDDSPEPASDMSLPRTPSTVNSSGDVFGSIPSNTSGEPSPWVYLA